MCLANTARTPTGGVFQYALAATGGTAMHGHSGGHWGDLVVVRGGRTYHRLHLFLDYTFRCQYVSKTMTLTQTTVSWQYFVSNFLTKTDALMSVVPNRGVKEVALEFMMVPHLLNVVVPK